jgi:hypothetical protein
MPWTFEHTWTGTIEIRNAERIGSAVIVLEKHAVNRPGSGIPVDRHVNEQTARAQQIVELLNAAHAVIAA